MVVVEVEVEVEVEVSRVHQGAGPGASDSILGDVRLSRVLPAKWQIIKGKICI